VLLCTDGLTRMVRDSEIASLLLENSDAQTSADRLVLLANEHGGEDNVSVIVVHIGDAV
jgi:protein phosphatase